MEQEVLEAEALKDELQLRNWNDVTAHHVRQILEMSANGEISAEQLSAIVSMAPHFLGLTKEAILTIANVSKELGERQRAAIEENNKILATTMAAIDKLLDKSQSDDTVLQIARLVEQASKLAFENVKTMNESNNSVFKQVFVRLASGVTAIGFVAFAILAGKGNRA